MRDISGHFEKTNQMKIFYEVEIRQDLRVEQCYEQFLFWDMFGVILKRGLGAKTYDTNQVEVTAVS